MQVYEGEHLTGDIVAHGSGVRDLYYGGAGFIQI